MIPPTTSNAFTSRTSSRRPDRKPRDGEAGSAYVIALLALVVLSILGLALALITQTEVQIGGNERTITRTFYATDSGIGEATARVLDNNDYRPRTFTLEAEHDDSGNPLDLQHQVAVSRFHPIQDAPCNLCQINQGAEYFQINHALTVESGLEANGGATELGRERLAVMVELQPRQADASTIVASQDELDDIEF